MPSPRWYEQIEPRTHEPVIDRTFRCVDCGKDTQGGEYYMVDWELAHWGDPHDDLAWLC